MGSGDGEDRLRRGSLSVCEAADAQRVRLQLLFEERVVQFRGATWLAATTRREGRERGRRPGGREGGSSDSDGSRIHSSDERVTSDRRGHSRGVSERSVDRGEGVDSRLVTLAGERAKAQWGAAPSGKASTQRRRAGEGGGGGGGEGAASVVMVRRRGTVGQR